MSGAPAVLDAGRAVLLAEADALAGLAARLDGAFEQAMEVLRACRGKIIVSGMGKSGHVGRKIAATFCGTGTPAVFLNPAEAGHGDLGMLAAQDVFLAISKSGKTAEVLALLETVKRLGLPLLAIVNDRDSPLGRAATVSLPLGIEAEACLLGLAPTSSTTAMLALGDALAVVLAGCKGFDEAAFARIHPAGNLGRQLRRVAELMQREGLPIVPEGTPVRQVLRVILAGHNRGVAIIVDAAGVLSGILVDGDLKRLLLRHGDLLDLPVETVMTRRPRTISRDACIGEALSIMEGRITSLLVVDREGRPEGLLHVHDILEMRVI